MGIDKVVGGSTPEDNNNKKKQKRNTKPKTSKKMASSNYALLIGLLVVSFTATAFAQCPPEGYDSALPFSLDAYVTDNATAWYVQQQQPISYHQLSMDHIGS